MRTSSDITRQKLITDFKVMMADAEDLLKATAGQSGDTISSIRARAENSLKNARSQLDDMQRTATEQAQQAAEYATRYVRENPVTTAATLAAVAFIVGWLVMRRS
jgi:ElaB/YqjD/DUF883 family membrane-anchored ribosome-binding protein